jgi:hypothetical protein
VAAVLPSDVRAFVLSDEGVEDPRRFRPLQISEPEDILFGCFFHDEDERAALLAYLRETASAPVEPAPGALAEEVARELEHYRLKGDTAGLLVETVRWWTGVKRRGYHAYKLRVGVDRYRCSCVIAFRERTPEELREAIMPAVEELEEAKERVAGFFQYPFD